MEQFLVTEWHDEGVPANAMEARYMLRIVRGAGKKRVGNPQF